MTGPRRSEFRVPASTPASLSSRRRVLYDARVRRIGTSERVRSTVLTCWGLALVGVILWGVAACGEDSSSECVECYELGFAAGLDAARQAQTSTPRGHGVVESMRRLADRRATPRPCLPPLVAGRGVAPGDRQPGEIMDKTDGQLLLELPNAEQQELQGIVWWNDLPPVARRYWLKKAGEHVSVEDAEELKRQAQAEEPPPNPCGGGCILAKQLPMCIGCGDDPPADPCIEGCQLAAQR